MKDLQLSRGQRIALENITMPQRVALSIVYIPAALIMVARYYIKKPFLFTHNIYDRLFLYLENENHFYDADIAAVLTWIAIAIGTGYLISLLV